ncbi:MAG TPA: peptidoglycan DD-metalloendopeptidase family protein [Burkholderiales bacterium]|nr:peptidoglycan DD-metalloendopeptidase family protein [Burkholderiales bacterium]
MKATTSSFKVGLLLAVNFVTGGCVSEHPAPVTEKSPAAVQAAKPAKEKAVVKQVGGAPAEFYTVQKGDTLYSIALAHDLDYRELAQWNNISDPATVSEGRQLRLAPPLETVITAPLITTPGVEGKPVENVEGKPLPPPGMVKTEPKAVKLPYSDQALAQLQKLEAPRSKSEPSPEIKPEIKTENKIESKTESKTENKIPGAAAGEIDWGWPAAGKVVSGFSETANLKGVDIAGKLGEPVLASAPGKVVYSGSGLRGYGKLIIIKHNDTYLSAYAHNSEILVKEGQAVVKGQKIGEMGDSDADQVKLHFEIRRLGKPVDPLKYLPANKTS